MSKPKMVMGQNNISWWWLTQSPTIKMKQLRADYTIVETLKACIGLLSVSAAQMP